MHLERCCSYIAGVAEDVGVGGVGVDVGKELV